jgi:hypothetical protein
VLNRIEGNTSTPSRPPVVAERVRVMVMSSAGELTGLYVVPPGDAVRIGGTTEDSVDRLPSAVAVVVAVVAGAVSCVLVPKGGGNEPSGWAKAGTKERRLDRDAEEGPAGSVSVCEADVLDAGGGRGEDEDEDDDAACVGSEAAAAVLAVLLAELVAAAVVVCCWLFPC